MLPLTPKPGGSSLLTRALIGGLACCLSLVLIPRSGVAGQEGPPLVVDADQVVYDDARQTVEATGSVALSYHGSRIKTDFAHAELREERVDAHGHVVDVESTGRQLRG